MLKEKQQSSANGGGSLDLGQETSKLVIYPSSSDTDSGDELEDHEPIAKTSCDTDNGDELEGHEPLAKTSTCKKRKRVGQFQEQHSEREHSQSYEAQNKQLLSDLHMSRQEVVRVKSNMENVLVAKNTQIEALKKQLAQSKSDLVSAKRELFASRQEVGRVKSNMEEALVAKNSEIEALKKQDAARTSILCRRWGHLWALAPDLRFSEPEHSKMPLFLDFMEKACSLRRGSAIRVFSLSCRVDGFVNRIKKLVSSFVSCGVRGLSLSLRCGRSSKTCAFPPAVFKCGILETLALQGPFFLKVQPSFCLSKLKVLKLREVIFDDRDSVDKLFSLSLERLEIQKCYWHGNASPRDPQVQINGSFLKSFHYEGDCMGELCISGDNTVHLVKATLVSRSTWSPGVKILMAFSTVKELTLSDTFLKHLAEAEIPLFRDLTRLTMHYMFSGMTKAERMKCLWTILGRCPNLRSLYFDWGFEYCVEDTKVGWLDPVPSCFLTKLKEVSFRVDRGTDWAEHSLVWIILEKATALKNLSLRCGKHSKLCASLLKCLDSIRPNKKCRILVKQAPG